MKSPMLKRRLNPFLIATIILVLSILAALSVLWQGTLTEVQTEKTNLSETLEQRNQEIQNLETENQNLSEQISSQQNELESLNNEKDLLESQLDSINLTVEGLEEQVEGLEDENSDLEESLDEMNDTFGIICSENNTIKKGEFRCNQYGHSYGGS